MTRRWMEVLDALDAVCPLPLLVILLLLFAVLVGVLLYFFPRWVPRRWPRWRRPRLRWPRWRWPRLRFPRWRLRLSGFRLPRWPGWAELWRRFVAWFKRRRPEPEAPDEAEPSEVEGLPDLPVEAFVSLADRLAAEGRYAEAIRERLRAIVRTLVDRGVIEHQPGWTITELARAAAAARPAVEAPLGAAARVFSDIWYGQRPASEQQDALMRHLTDQVTTAIAFRVGAAS